jgi:hypothetical protein
MHLRRRTNLTTSKVLYAARSPSQQRPWQKLKWSIERATHEFRLAQNTLRKYLHQADCEPDETGCYSTEQLCQAIFGDLRAEKLRKERELTRKYSLEDEVTEGNLLDRNALARAFGTIADAFVSRVMSVQGLSRREKEDLLKDLATWPLSLEEVSDRQTKHSRRGNGQAPDENGNED